MGIIINGKSFSGSSKSISINGSKIFIDGVNVTPNEKNINIEITGNVDKLEVDCCDKITISGDVGSLKNGSGDVTCQNIKEYATSGSGNMEIGGTIGGNVQTGSGDVSCKGNILGNVKTGSGDIKYTKGSNNLKD